MSFLTSIEHFFERLFGKQTGEVIQTIMTDIHKLFQEAQPIVSAISAVITAEDLASPSAVLKKLEAYLGTVLTDAAKVDEWVKANTGQAIPTLLENAALTALSFVSGNSILNDLKTAITLAYAVYCKLNPATTGNATVATVMTPAVSQPQH